MTTEILPKETATALVRATRAAVGDEVRSVTYFTPEHLEQLYLREDLAADADVAGFAETERRGFHSQTDYAESELGEHHFTIRVFDHGYLTRVIQGEDGVFVTTDPMTRDRFEELAAALAEELDDIEH